VPQEAISHLYSFHFLPSWTQYPGKYVILFADDTSIIITNPIPSKFKEDINNTIDNINNWFRCNSLSLNFDRTYFLQFRPKNSYEIDKKK